ncbi:MAG: (2Fe-2S)-binding protein [Pseudomonadota bacterium]
MEHRIQFTLNGQSVGVDVAPNVLLADVLRTMFRLTGTHIGCDTSQCGACTVHLNGRAIKSCSIFAVQVDGEDVTTIEGIGTPDNLHPMQAAFQDCHGLQCGFCTPGMIMSAIDLVAQQEPLDEAAIRSGLKGNLCRCTGYQNIVEAIAKGAEAMAEAGPTVKEPDHV